MKAQRQTLRRIGVLPQPLQPQWRVYSRSQSTKAVLPPHSLLPTKMLLRSLLVATISSHRALLTPALKVLSMIAHPRIGLLSVEKNPILRAFLKTSFYNHFCAGENNAEVSATIGRIKNMGMKGVILTYAREIGSDNSSISTPEGTSEQREKGTALDKPSSSQDPQIEAWCVGVMETVEMIGEHDFLALKFTGAGAAAADALQTGGPLPSQMMNALKAICNRAVERKARIFIDAEQQSVQDGIDQVALDLMRLFNRDGRATVYNTYQAYLKSTPTTLHAHMDCARKENFTLGVKLVRGAYINSEPRHLINDTKANTDTQYDSIAADLLKREYGAGPFPSVELFLATHNKESVLKAHGLYQARIQSGEPTVKVQYGQLLGMADEVSCRMLQIKEEGNGDESLVAPEVYKCLSWGTLGDCLSYLLRRAVENRDAVSRTTAEYVALKTEAKRRFMMYFRS
ncbi:FAD-linked oxidoreductase [Aspergillus steynii IBT 23096]|uniref:Proline dehydrogenase n=1 Tax=Aspergillus steynii IBT 23096 TaxID=1392250 RepID=A0A2I2G6F8_9EURO|nr:FAD-linked oxidoreductase [Aspergillus steynii IBT 23096]PLB48461.1 FAD-linked oxidoreductase [Aspergillus steynii IBT 23096]